MFVYGGCTVGSQLLDDLFALNVKSRVLTKVIKSSRCSVFLC